MSRAAQSRIIIDAANRVWHNFAACNSFRGRQLHCALRCGCIVAALWLHCSCIVAAASRCRLDWLVFLFVCLFAFTLANFRSSCVFLCLSIRGSHSRARRSIFSSNEHNMESEKCRAHTSERALQCEKTHSISYIDLNLLWIISRRQELVRFPSSP